MPLPLSPSLTDSQKRLALFLGGCIPVRLFITWVASRAANGGLQIMGVIALCVSFGFAYIWATGARKTGAEVFGAPIWWDNLRPIHAVLWATFAVMAISGNRSAWVVLLFDTLFGLAAFTAHRLMTAPTTAGA